MIAHAGAILIMKAHVSTRVMNKTLRSIFVISVIGEMFFIYGLLGWIYGVAIQFYQPTWLPVDISHLTPWLRLDTFTVFSFFASAIGFFIWRLSSKLFKYSNDFESR